MLVQIAAMSQVSTARPAFTQMSLRSIPQRAGDNVEVNNQARAKNEGSLNSGNLSGLINSLISRVLEYSTGAYQALYTALLNLVPNLSQGSFMTVDSFRSLLYNVVEEIFGVIDLPKSNPNLQTRETGTDHFVPLSSQNSNSIVSAKDRQFTYQSVNAKAGNQAADVQSIPFRGSAESQSQSFPGEANTFSSDPSRNIAFARLYLVGQA